MRPRSEDHSVVPSGDFDRLVSELKRHVQGVELRPVPWGDHPSPHMTPELMFSLAMDVDRVLAEPGVLGAVVLHGTDVLVESAYMADLTVNSPKPVVFTGSMRFLSELGYDGIRNLLNSIKACLLPIPPETGVVLLMNDRIFAARDVAKINSLNVDAFEAPDSGPVAYVAGEIIQLTHRPTRSAGKERWKSLQARALELNVPLITCYTGMDGALIDCLRANGPAGLVVEGFGAGNVPPGLAPSLEALVKDGIPVVLTTRCVEGGVSPVYGYLGGGADLRKKGVILGGRLAGPKARIKLMLALTVTRDMDEIRDLFEHD